MTAAGSGDPQAIDTNRSQPAKTPTDLIVKWRTAADGLLVHDGKKMRTVEEAFLLGERHALRYCARDLAVVTERMEAPRG